MGEGVNRFTIVLGQRMSWQDMLSRALETESLGFDGFFLVDHFYGLKNLDDPTHEAYTMLGALAPFTQRLRLGIMVCGNTYRNPAFLLKQAITVDHISGGRVDFGVGAGWVEREHEAYGWEFPSAKERVDRFEEALQIWDLLQRQERTTFDGEFYKLLDAPFQPKSLQGGRLPLLIGGSGSRMLRLTARYADIWNVVGTPEEAKAVNARMDEACRSVDRDPESLVRSVSPSINLLASVEAFEQGVAQYREAGFRDIYMPWPRVDDEVPVLREVARKILPGLQGKAKPMGAPGGQRAIEDATQEELSDVVRSIGDGRPRRLLNWLIDHSDEQFDGSALQRALEFERHSDVTSTMAVLGDHFTVAGFNRPWIEAQRGYTLPTMRAELLRPDDTQTG